MSLRVAPLAVVACMLGALSASAVAGTVPRFSGSAVADFARIQAAPGAVSEVPDPAGSGETVLALTVGNRDVAPITPTVNPRAQLISPAVIEPGDEFWLQTRLLIPRSLPRVSGWLSLVSVYGAPFDGPSPWQLAIEGDEFVWERNGNYRWDIPWRAPLVKGRWLSLLVHERFGAHGWVEMWFDDQPVRFFAPGAYNPTRHAPTNRLRMATMDASNRGGANAAKIMQYRQAGMFRWGTVYFKGLQIGPTRASVDP